MTSPLGQTAQTDQDDPLVAAIDAAQTTYDAAREAADAARQAVADAESAVAAYEGRVQAGDLPVTAGTLASKRDSVELARLALPSAEQREADALDDLRSAVVARTVRDVAENPALSGAILTDAIDRAKALFVEALAVLESASIERNEAVTEAAEGLSAVDAPIARRQLAANTEIPNPGEVHLLLGMGTSGVLMPDDRELVPTDARRWSHREIARIVKAALPQQVRKDIL